MTLISKFALCHQLVGLDAIAISFFSPHRCGPSHESVMNEKMGHAGISRHQKSSPCCAWASSGTRGILGRFSSYPPRSVLMSLPLIMEVQCGVLECGIWGIGLLRSLCCVGHCCKLLVGIGGLEFVGCACEVLCVVSGKWPTFAMKEVHCCGLCV